MKLILCLIVVATLVLDATYAQAPADAALKFDVTLNKDTPSITLEWNLVRISTYNFTNKAFSVYKTNVTNLQSFGSPVKTIPIVAGVNTYSYVDTDVEVISNINYEDFSSFDSQKMIFSRSALRMNTESSVHSPNKISKVLLSRALIFRS